VKDVKDQQKLFSEPGPDGPPMKRV